MIKKVIPLFILLMIILSLFQCALFTIASQTRKALSSTILSGRIIGSKDIKGPIIVVAYQKINEEIIIEHYAYLDAPGSYELMVGEGDYYLFAFEDKNNDFVFDFNEFAGQYGAPDKIELKGGGLIQNLDIAISSKRLERTDFPVGYKVKDGRPDPRHSTLAGTLFSFDDPLFSLETAIKGYYAPVEFFRNIGGNIYFLEKYDPKKIPVLFIHGAMGSPVNFEAFAEQFDRKKYQLWFYYYPSGSHLTSMANLLNKKLGELQLNYRFNSLYIVAHSIGGLVARKFLIDFAESYPYIRGFYTLCTPWGGVEDAEKGVESSPVVLNSWRDLATGSEFISSLYIRKIGRQIPFYLFFGFKGDRVPWKAANDGTITLESQLDERAQLESLGTFGFNDGHTGILEDKEVIQQIQTLIYAESRKIAELKGGFISLQINGLSEEVVPLQFYARLIRHNKTRKEIQSEKMLYLDPLLGKQVIGPIPAGKYSLNLLAYGFKANPEKFSLIVSNGRTNEFSFSISLEILVYATVVNATANPANSRGMLQAIDQHIDLAKIILEGQGLHREIIPDNSQTRSFSSLYSDYKDFYSEGRLMFFDVPKGKYKLSLYAEGYKTKEIEMKAASGHLNILSPIVMEKE